MDTINTILELYKVELALANERKIILQAQCKQYEQKIELLEKELEDLKKEKE